MCLGWNETPEQKPFLKLLNNQIFFIHFIIHVILGGFGVALAYKGYFQYVFLLAPTLFLLLLRLLDPIVVKLTRRHLYFVGKGDSYPKDYRWYLDAPIAVLLGTIPLCTCGYLMNFFRFGTFMCLSLGGFFIGL